MPKSSNLASMTVDALLKLRDDVADVLGRKADELKHQLSMLGDRSPAKRGRPAGRKAAARGGKVAPKYRGPDGQTWSGRGLKPRWLTAALNDGATLESFLIESSGKAGAKKTRRGRKKGA